MSKKQLRDEAPEFMRGLSYVQKREILKKLIDLEKKQVTGKKPPKK